MKRTILPILSLIVIGLPFIEASLKKTNEILIKDSNSTLPHYFITGQGKTKATVYIAYNKRFQSADLFHLTIPYKCAEKNSLFQSQTVKNVTIKLHTKPMSKNWLTNESGDVFIKTHL